MTVACSSASVEEEEDVDAEGALTTNDEAAIATQRELALLVGEQRERLVEVAVYGDTHVCTVVSAANEIYSDVSFDADDKTKLVVFRGTTFAMFDGTTGGAAALSTSSEQIAKDLDLVLRDTGSEASSAPGLRPQSWLTNTASTVMSKGAIAAFNVLRNQAREQIVQAMNISLKTLKNPATETAELVEAATKKAQSGLTAGVRGRTEVVGKALDVPDANWTKFTADLTAAGTKAVYFGDEGAKQYLAKVAADNTVMFMTHSGKLSDKALAANPALRSYYDRGAQFMAEAMELMSKQDTRPLRVIGGGTLEGGQVPVYTAVAQLRTRGVEATADSILAGPGHAYRIAPSENVVVQGLDWGGESVTATMASKRGFLWGGGGQAKKETLRLLQEGKDVWVVRESGALRGIEIPNAAAEVEAAAQEAIAAGLMRPEAKARLHVFETWEECIAALRAAAVR